MATATASRPVSQPGRYDRTFYSGMAIAMALAVLIGFARTFYLSWYFGTHGTITGAPFTPVVRIHAALFTAWVLLFLVQTSLVATHRVAVHRRMGVVGAVLAGLMAVAGTTIALEAARRGSAPPGISPKQFLAIPLGDIAGFVVLVALALWLRRNKETHKRLMLLAYLAILAAAVARFPGVLPLGPLAFYGFTFIPFLAAAMIYDWVTRGRVHPVYLWGGGLLVASVPLRLMISTTHTWQRVAEVLIGR
jgi:uncharacterized membrane protein YozB (DUF420 family)